MNRETLGKAIDAANVFITNARCLYADMKHDEKAAYNECKVSPKQTGQVRRNSIDLTRALAEMRRPG